MRTYTNPTETATMKRNRKPQIDLDAALHSLAASARCLRMFVDNADLMQDGKHSAEIGQLWWLVDRVTEGVADVVNVHMGDIDGPIVAAHLSPGIEVH